MAFTFQGEFVVRRKPEEVFDFLADPNRFCPLLPDFEKMTTTDASHFTVSLKVGIAHIRGTANVKMTLEEGLRPTSARYSGKREAWPEELSSSDRDSISRPFRKALACAGKVQDRFLDSSPRWLADCSNRWRGRTSSG